MGVQITRVTLWQTKIPNQPGALGAILEPLAQSQTDLQFVAKYSLPGRSTRATVEILPRKGRRATIAIRRAGFSLSPTPVLLVEGTNRPGLAYAVTNSIAWAGINLRFLSAQVVGDRYSALLGFQSDDDRRKGASLIRKVANDGSRSEPHALTKTKTKKKKRTP